jgi:hypothetical protein
VFCENDGRPAAFQCAGCSRALCEGCVRRIGAGRHSVPVCPVCGAYVEPVTASPRNLSARTFWYYAATAIVWPFAGRGVLVIVLNGLFISIAFLLTTFFPPGRILINGYAYLLLMRVIQSTSLGDNEAPATPGVESLGDLFKAYGRIALLFAVCTVPAIIAWQNQPVVSLDLLGFVYLALQGPATLAVFLIVPGADAFVRFLAVLGLLIMPMSLLAISTFESVRGLNPVPIVVTILRVPVQYVACCVLFYAIPVLAIVLFAVAFAVNLGFFEGTVGAPSITLAMVLAYFGLWLVIVYALYAAGRVLGGLHAANSARFGWVRT